MLSIDPCFTNSCFINPRFINPCFTNPVLLLLIQSSGTSGNAAQFTKRVRCQLQDNTSENHATETRKRRDVHTNIGALPSLLATIVGRHVIRPSTNFLGDSFRPVWSCGLYGVGHHSQMCNKLGERRLVQKCHTQSGSARPSTSAGTERRR